MPVKNEAYWQVRSGKRGTTWYLDKRLDRWMDRLWRDAFKRLGVQISANDAVLDIGCGDGKNSIYLAGQYGCWVSGCDLFEYDVPFDLFPQELLSRVSFYFGVDAEEVSQRFRREFSLVLISGVLECVSNWKKALEEATQMADRIILIEDLPLNTPSYQKNLRYKTPITWAEIIAEIQNLGWKVVRWVPMTIIDRRLYYRIPSWLHWFVVPLSGILDLIVARLSNFHPKVRFRCCLLEKEK